MKAKLSPLILSEFSVLQTEYHFQFPLKKVNVEELFQKYKVDIDFGKIEIGDEYRVFVKVGINTDEKALPGYSVFIESVSVFRFDPKQEITDEKKDFYLLNSGVSMAIGSIRSYIVNLTAYSPMGKYMLPAIDMQHLIQHKLMASEAITERKSGKKK